MPSSNPSTSLVNGIDSHTPSDIIYTRPLKHDIQETRILKLQRGTWKDDIVCQLDIVSLDEEPEFEAVSYYWGDFNKKRPIEINGQRLEVSVNLEHALRLFRKPDEDRALWADAVCIKQEDIGERSAQVALMRDIYQQSSGVLIYLGDGPDDSGETKYTWDGTLADQKKLDDYKKRFIQFWRLPVAMRHTVEQDYELGVFCFIYMLATNNHLTNMPFFRSHSTRENILAALDRLMKKPWWRRQWVVQETVLAKQALLYYGRFVAPWTMFTKAAANYQKHRVGCCSKIHAEFPLVAVEAATRFSQKVLDLQEVKLMFEREQRMSLLALLWQFRNRDTSNARDKVYALLPLVNEWGQRPGLTPNYTYSVQQLYYSVVREVIRAMKSLTVLMGTTEKTENNEKGFPSWIPDWGKQTHDSEVQRLHRAPLYKASGDRQPKVRYFDRSYMESQGFQFDVVYRIGDVMPVEDENKSISTFETWSKLVNAGNEAAEYVAGGKQTEAYWKLLCMDTVWKRDSDDILHGQGKYVRTHSGYGREYEHVWLTDPNPETGEANDPDAVQDLRTRHGNLYLRTGTTIWPDLDPNPPPARTRSFLSRRDTFALHSQSEDLDVDHPTPLNTTAHNYATMVNHAIKTATAGRVLFVTEKGYIGLGPPSTALGDEVCILVGGSTPFVLRNMGERYVSPKVGDVTCHSLIGDCYVQGIMQGEAMENADDKLTNVYLA